MRVAAFGTGGAGGYFGAKLAQAGEDVVVAKQEQISQNIVALQKANSQLQFLF
jgi:ketopantoate reductase